jgi:hypothetical protein
MWSLVVSVVDGRPAIDVLKHVFVFVLGYLDVGEILSLES